MKKYTKAKYGLSNRTLSPVPSRRQASCLLLIRRLPESKSWSADRKSSMTSQRRAKANYQLLVVLAVTIVDVGACSPTGPSSESGGSSGGSSSSSGSDGRRNGLVERGDGRAAPSAPRFFIDSDMIMQFAMHNVENLPKPMQGPAMFAMGFSQQNMKNFMSTVRSLGQMLISSLVMMAVKRLFFADLKTEADRNKASGLTDALLNIINLLNF